MALGIPTFKGQSNRSWYQTNVSVNCSSTIGDLILVGALLTGGGVIPAISGHGASFVQIGSTQSVGSLISVSLFGGFSAGGSSQDITAVFTGADASLGIQVVTISGIDNDGPVADAIKQIAQGSFNGSAPSLTFGSTPTKTTIHFWGQNGNTLLDGNTSLGTQSFAYGGKAQACGYAASGNSNPTGGSSTQWGGIAVELQEPPVASSGGAYSRLLRSNGTFKHRAGG